MSGNGNGGTWSGTPAGVSSTYYASGKVGLAGVFDGSSTYIGLSGITVTIPFTISFWVKPTVFMSSAAQSIFGPSTCPGFGIYSYGTAMTADISCQGGSGASFNYTLNQWQMVTVIYSNTSNRSIYQNGVLAGTNISSSSQTTSLYSAVGRQSGGIQYWNGSIDDVRVYNRALSASEIRTLYNAEE
jgi:hypothetical protein